MYAQIKKLPAHRMVDSEGLAREAGSMLATNMVMVGAASSSLPIDNELIESTISDVFKRKGDHVVEVNIKAFRLGGNAG